MIRDERGPDQWCHVIVLRSGGRVYRDPWHWEGCYVDKNKEEAAAQWFPWWRASIYRRMSCVQRAKTKVVGV
eukprot:1238678-Alexandrium_andersonii.AAC.1